jgi:hypothetical protein
VPKGRQQQERPIQHEDKFLKFWKKWKAILGGEKKS